MYAIIAKATYPNREETKDAQYRDLNPLASGKKERRNPGGLEFRFLGDLLDKVHVCYDFGKVLFTRGLVIGHVTQWRQVQLHRMNALRWELNNPNLNFLCTHGQNQG